MNSIYDVSSWKITRDVLFRFTGSILPLTLRMSASEQLTEQYQIRWKSRRNMKLMNFCETVKLIIREKKLQEFVSESLAEKGIDAASLHRWHAR